MLNLGNISDKIKIENKAENVFRVDNGFKNSKKLQSIKIKNIRFVFKGINIKKLFDGKLMSYLLAI